MVFPPCGEIQLFMQQSPPLCVLCALCGYYFPFTQQSPSLTKIFLICLLKPLSGRINFYPKVNVNPNDQYQVIARKYRPQKFSDVVGQEAIITTLKNALRWNRIAHAYLFCGCRGTGKTTLARLFAKVLNCDNRTQDYEPCDACPSCLDIRASRALDVLEIDGASNRGIEDIRQINETIGYAPSGGRYKIYIIDEVHMLTKEAFNALLKTLEEPPAQVKFFFATTEPHKVPPTILSRCQRFDLGRIPLDALVKKLSAIAEDLKIPCEAEIFSLIAQLAEGSLRDAESLLDQVLCYGEPPLTLSKTASILGILPQTALYALDQAFAEQNFSFAFELADQIFTSGKEISHFLDTLLEHYRRILRHKLGTPTPFYTPKEQEQFLTSATLYTQEQCLYILDYILHWQQQLSKIPFKRITLEMILLHILHSKHRVTLPSLIKRLHDLQSQTVAEPIVVEKKPESPERTLASRIPEVAPALPPIPEPRSEETGKEKQAEPPELTFPSPIPEADAALPPILEPVFEKTVEEERSEPPELTLPPLSPQANTATPPIPEPISEEMSLEESLLKKMKQRLEAQPPLEPETNLQTQAPSVPPLPTPADDLKSLVRHETLMRFAAVELEGVLKKESPNG